MDFVFSTNMYHNQDKLSMKRELYNSYPPHVHRLYNEIISTTQLAFLKGERKGKRNRCACAGNKFSRASYRWVNQRR